MMTGMVWTWLAVMALAVFAEMSTMALVSVWCAVGALAVVFAAYFGAPLAAQLLLFIGVSIVTAAVVRPLAKKYADPYKVPTNADRVIGRDAVVTEAIDNLTGSGAVVVSGVAWTARSEDGHPIPEGTAVVVKRIEGVKLFVTAKP